MTNMLIDRMVKKASKSSCKYKVAGIAFDRRGKCLGIDYNRPRFHWEGGTIHAEMALMNRYGSLIQTIVICRVTRGGKLKRMDACSACQAKADDLGITITSLI